VTPAKRSKDREPEETLTTELFVMGPRAAFRNWQATFGNWAPSVPALNEITTIEEVEAPTVSDKIKGQLPRKGETVFEVVLHTDELMGKARILPQFQKYLKTLGLDATLDRRFFAGGLCFVELDAPSDLAEDIAVFTPVRALRQMPRLRMLRPTFRSSRIPVQTLVLPTEPPIDETIRAAIFDGGLPSGHPLTAWATPIDATGVGAAWTEFQKHGVAVTSAFLFGHIDPTKPLPRPYSAVDHYRVLDTTPGQNPHELYDVLGRIDHVLVNKRYDFINLSIGPQLPVEDDDVHPWTAVIDDRLSRGGTLATVAVGNDGEGDADERLNRIQAPADCVNALAIGACDSPDEIWQRCAYSSVGPGRSPGLIKPDFVEFGGCLQRPFIAINESHKVALEATEGTSFSAPSVLRLATGVRAHFGANLNTLAIRALLIHTSEACDYPCEDVGRGRVARSVQDIVLSDDDTVRVVYQGTISATRYIRAPIPLPSGVIPGTVRITATLCYMTDVDPHHPGNYTRAGLEASFRPHDQKRKSGKQIHANPKSFFGRAQRGLMEDELRRDAWKWENTLHGTVSFQGKSLSNPVFDIHYNSRLEGRDFAPDEELAYALIITVQAKRMPDFYDRILRKYASQLEALTPVVEIPIMT
jgi:hypothetical protein